MSRAYIFLFISTTSRAKLARYTKPLVMTSRVEGSTATLHDYSSFQPKARHGSRYRITNGGKCPGVGVATSLFAAAKQNERATRHNLEIYFLQGLFCKQHFGTFLKRGYGEDGSERKLERLLPPTKEPATIQFPRRRARLNSKILKRTPQPGSRLYTSVSASRSPAAEGPGRIWCTRSGNGNWSNGAARRKARRAPRRRAVQVGRAGPSPLLPVPCASASRRRPRRQIWYLSPHE